MSAQKAQGLRTIQGSSWEEWKRIISSRTDKEVYLDLYVDALVTTQQIIFFQFKLQTKKIEVVARPVVSAHPRPHHHLY